MHMKHQRVLLTGGSGRLGRFVVDELSKVCDVAVLDLVAPEQDVEFIQGDVLDLAVTREASKGRDAVVHLAAIDFGVPAEPEAYFGVNVMGTWNVLQAAHEAGLAKAVLASSISANGVGEMRQDFVPEYLPVDEAHPLKPVHPYGVSKLVVEDVARSFARRGEMPILCLRPTAVVFPVNLDRLVERANNPEHRWLAAYVTGEDTACAFRLALEHDGTGYDAFFVTAADSASNLPTLERVLLLYGAVPSLRDPDLYHNEPRASMIDATRAREVLGWAPTSSWPEVAARLDRTW